MIKAKIVTSVEVVDPDTGNDVEVVIYKLDNGAMVGIDASFVEWGGRAYSPYDPYLTIYVEGDEPDGMPAEDPHWGPPTGLHCSVCGEPQYTTPGGHCCKNGHGGAPSKEEG